MKNVAEPQVATDDRMCGAKNIALHAGSTLFTKIEARTLTEMSVTILLIFILTREYA